MRVSTNAEEQLQSFKSQKEYYQDKISANKEWALVGIYADEGITGTKTNKRDEFLRMIDDWWILLSQNPCPDFREILWMCFLIQEC